MYRLAGKIIHSYRRTIHETFTIDVGFSRGVVSRLYFSRGLNSKQQDIRRRNIRRRVGGDV